MEGTACNLPEIVALKNKYKVCLLCELMRVVYFISQNYLRLCGCTEVLYSIQGVSELTLYSETGNLGPPYSGPC